MEDLYSEIPTRFSFNHDVQRTNQHKLLFFYSDWLISMTFSYVYPHSTPHPIIGFYCYAFIPINNTALWESIANVSATGLTN